MLGFILAVLAGVLWLVGFLVVLAAASAAMFVPIAAVVGILLLVGVHINLSGNDQGPPSGLGYPPAGGSFCDTHQCIPSFYEGNGSIVQCNDGEWSHSGGLQGACSGHGGESSPYGF